MGLSALTGAETWVKHENFQPTGAFKVRGGVNLVSQLSQKERRQGVIAASTGNHGQSVAYAARLFGVSATICAPAGANRVKVAAMEELGANVILHGADFDEAREHCEKLARWHGHRYVHSGNEPLLIAGVGTATLEALETRPDLDVLIVPVGGGSGAAGACIVAAAINPEIEVIGVQSAQAPAAYLAWREEQAGSPSSTTFAEGLATRIAFDLPQRVLRERLSDFVLVDDTEIREAVAMMIEHTRTLVEPAGAASLAAAIKLRERLEGRRIALVCSGGNITPEQLRDVLAAMRPAAPPARAG
ncbi:MAG TPA: pyridoxal-phosphate dependent enzyme [Candidatus Dormibacteraeota bacterium]|nr:pyridoxal-phosphate dependent enzyme [Candidatus Dormibacteraeota bacterium]